MLNFPIQNIANIGREIILFNRQADGKLSMFRDKNFFPYFFQESSTGIFRTITGKKVNKVFCKLPSEVARKRDENSYEADILYPKRYLIDKVGEIIKSPIKYIFIDIEIQTKEGLPNYLYPEQPITCISIYNSLSKEIKTFWIENYYTEKTDSYDLTLEGQESSLLTNFVKYIKDEQPDILLGWNFVLFDYPYLCARIKKLWNLDLAELISPINKQRYGLKEMDISYPAGISILDYMDLFKKVYKSGEMSYALEQVSNKYVNFPLNKKVDFGIISVEIKEKNIQDIDRMVRLEEKLKLIPYFDEIRRMGKCLWEDLTWHSKVLDVMLLSEAKQKGIILPSKKYDEFNTDEKEFEGAYRRADLGRFENLWKLDLSSAYPMAIIEFCLDISNLTENKNEQKIDITDRETEEIKYSIYVKQNQNALLPTIARKLIAKKDTIKKQLKILDPESEEGKDLQIKYDAIKALTNSLFGVCALKVFRLYNVDIASAITSIVRDLLHYVEDKLEEQNIKVTYLDTDSAFVMAKENPVDLLNNLTQQWIKEKYNREKTDIEFDYEGIFEKVLVVALCHYIGYLRKKNNKIKKEIKGVEVKRKDSSIFIKKFQEELIEKILNNESQEDVIKFINLEKERFKTLPLIEIAFPCRAKTSEKSPTIFMRALQYSQEINPNFKKYDGELFYYLYVNSFGQAERHAKQMRKSKKTGEKYLLESHTTVDKNVLAFDGDDISHILKIGVNYDEMIRRNILDKAEKIFDAMKWDKTKIGITIKEKRPNKTKAEIVKEQETIIKSQPTFTEEDFLVEDKEPKKEIKPYYSE